MKESEGETSRDDAIGHINKPTSAGAAAVLKRTLTVASWVVDGIVVRTSESR